MQQKFLFVLLGTFLFSSCLYDAVYNLDADELVWLEPYKQRDTVVFVSEQGKDMDTMPYFVKMRDLLFTLQTAFMNARSFIMRGILNAGFLSRNKKRT